MDVGLGEELSWVNCDHVRLCVENFHRSVGFLVMMGNSERHTGCAPSLAWIASEYRVVLNEILVLEAYLVRYSVVFESHL